MLREFFVNEHPSFLFKQFGLIHNIFIITTILILILIYKKRNEISNIPKDTSKKILKIAAIIMLVNMIIYTFGNLYFGSFDYKKDLPFHLCFIANYMFMYGILFDKPVVLRITLFMSFIGPIPAILWPDLISTIDNYNFWQYVISHHFFICMSLFSYYALGYKIKKIDFIKTFILTNVLMICMYPFNKLFNMNYIFSTEIPANVLELYPFIEPIPPVITLEVVGLVIFTLVYFIIVKRRNKELENNL